LNPDTQFAVQVLVMAAMVIGLFGLIIPIFPGLNIIWASALGYGILTGFPTIGIWMFALMTVLMVAGNLVDNLFIGAKALQKGGSWWTILIATAGGILGSLILPPIGGLVFALGGAFLYEYSRHKDWRKALNLTQGMAVGCGWAFVVRFFIGMLMIGLWIIWAF